MKKVNLNEAVRAYANFADAAKNSKWQSDCADRSAGTVWFTRNKEFADYAHQRMVEAQKIATDAANNALSACLDEVQSKCKVRTINALDVVSALFTVEEKLDISKKALDGVSVCIDLNAQDFPNAYKFTPESTVFYATFKGGHWSVTDIRREQTHRPSRAYVITHTDASKAALIDRFSTWA